MSGTIYDTGYKRYVGTRLPRSTRWRAIAKQQVKGVWKLNLRYKLPLLMVLPTFVVFVVGLVLPTAISINQFKSLNLPDSIMVAALQWFPFTATVMSLTITATVIASDRKTGALPFYFARPITVLDYLGGKIVGMCLLIGAVTLAAPTLLACVRVGLNPTLGTVLGDLSAIPKVMAVGVLATGVYAIVPLAFSTMTRRPDIAIGLWAAWYFPVGGIAVGLAHNIHPAFSMLHLPACLRSLAMYLFGVKGNLLIAETHLPPLWALISLVAHIVLAASIAYVALSRAYAAGIGSS